MADPAILGSALEILATGAVALVSAFIGVRGALRAADRQVRATLEAADRSNAAARERERYEATLQKREEIISELYASVQDLERIVVSVSWPYPGETSVEEQGRTNDQFFVRLTKVRDDLDKSAIWLDAESANLTYELLNKYFAYLGDFNVLLSRVKRPRGELDREATEEEKVVDFRASAEGLSYRFRREVEPLLDELRDQYRRSAGIAGEPEEGASSL